MSESCALSRVPTATEAGSEDSENIKVVVRCRPLSKKEIESGCKSIVETDLELKQVTVTPPTSASPASSPQAQGDGFPKSFTFDHVFNESCTQAQVYDAVARPIVQNVLEGYNGTIFAYGQTGTGKTFTMEGLPQPELKGIIPSSFAQIFNCIGEAKEGQKFLVRCSYLEIYNENIRDLLCDDQTKYLDLKENKDKEVFVKDLASMVVCDPEDMDRLMAKGNKNRSVAFTNMNADSSRSHAVFSIVVECSTECKLESGAEPTGEDPDEAKCSLRMGKLNLVDLAGSERLAKTGATGDRLKEATKINLSLSNLGNVISALVDGASYIPYRNSKLTRLLQDSLGGNSKTVMVATVGPADFNYEETVGTLRYANRAKNIKNCAKINEDPKDALLRQYREELFRLRSLLERKKVEVKEQEQRKGQEKVTPAPQKKKRSGLTTARSGKGQEMTIQEEIDTLVQEQKKMDQKHKEDLKALLEPFGIKGDRSPKEIMEELERKKKELVNAGEAVKEENEKLLEELQQVTDAMINSKRQCKVLFHRVMCLESQLQQSELKDEELRMKEIELQEQNAKEENFRKALELKKLTANDLKKELSKLQEEIEMKSSKASKMSQKMDGHKEQLQKLKWGHLQRLEQIQELKEELKKELKLKKMIVDNFIPRKVLKKLEERMRYDEKEDKYVLAPRTDTSFERPKVNRKLINPYLNLTRYKNLAKVNNIYYSDENLLAVEPEMPCPKAEELVLEEEEDPMLEQMVKDALRELQREVVIVCDHRSKTNQLPHISHNLNKTL